MASKSVQGKILAVLFPITAFVALGFEHVVANMFFLPFGLMLDHAAVTWPLIVHNLVPVLLGNILGGALFVGGAYYLAYVKK